MSAPRSRLRTVATLTTLWVASATAACDSLFGSFAADNPDNCVLNAMLCTSPDQACNTVTKLCEPAVMLASVDPPGGSNVGGETLTLGGQRFVPGMTVNIDGVPADQVTVVSDTKITVMSPPRPGRQGLVSIELVHPAGQRIQNSKLFRYYSLVTFRSVCSPLPNGHSLMATGDLNQDGKVDLVLGGYFGTDVYLSNGDGTTFHNSASIDKNSFKPPVLQARDLNGDGKLDLISFVSAQTSSINTALGNGDGTFAPVVSSPTPLAPYGLAIGDVTGDKRLDAVSFQNREVVIQPGNGDGTFGTPQNMAIFTIDPMFSSSSSLVDMDGDGLLDDVPALPGEESFRILYGQAGGWTSTQPVALQSQPESALVGDYNQDGILDVAIGYSLSAGQVTIFQGLGGRMFQALPAIMLPDGFFLVGQGDVNGDGMLDLLTVNPMTPTDNVMVYLGTGGSRFLALAPLTANQGVSIAIAGDWDGDGKQDLAASTSSILCVMHSMTM